MFYQLFRIKRIKKQKKNTNKTDEFLGGSNVTLKNNPHERTILHRYTCKHLINMLVEV